MSRWWNGRARPAHIPVPPRTPRRRVDVLGKFLLLVQLHLRPSGGVTTSQMFVGVQTLPGDRILSVKPGNLGVYGVQNAPGDAYKLGEELYWECAKGTALQADGACVVDVVRDLAVRALRRYPVREPQRLAVVLRSVGPRCAVVRVGDGDEGVGGLAGHRVPAERAVVAPVLEPPVVLYLFKAKPKPKQLWKKLYV